MPVYTWREGMRAAVPAQIAGETLAEIRARHGTIEPRTVVEESRPKGAPLHACFEWNRDRAAALYNDEQARQLIRCVCTVADDGPPDAVPTIAFVHVTTEESSGYLPTAEVMASSDYRGQALAEALALLKGVRRRFAHLKELSGVFDAIDHADAHANGNSNGAKPRRKKAKV